MSKRVLVGEAEFMEPADYERFTAYPQDATDDLVEDAVAYPAHWSGYTVARRSAQEVEVSPGRYFEGRTVYGADAAIRINLTTFLPLAASDERWVALIARGRVVELKEDRAFDTSTDPETQIPVDQPFAAVEAREAYITVQQGVAAPSPALKPTIAATDACIAFVRLTTQGVQDIEPGEGWRAKTLFEVEGRVTVLEVRFGQIIARTEVLETGMSNANAAIDELRRGMIRPEIMREVRRDVAAMRRQLNVPEGARSSYYDPGLVLDQWDTKHARWLARVDEGIQMPFAQSREARLQVKNEDDPRIMFVGRRMVPAFDKVKRIFNEGGKSTRLISQVTHTEIEAIQRSVSRTSTSYGPTINFCANQAEWSRFVPAAQAGANFAKDGETFQGLGKNEAASFGPHQVYQARSVKVQSWTETYWEYVPKTVGLNGSVYGQTFLVDQPLISPSVELEFAKVGTDGAVHVIFCATDETGAPVIDDIIATAKLEARDIKVGWNEFVADLTYFDPGKRYGWYAVTTGNHTLYGTDANAFSGGTSFRFTDGAWAQGDLTFDFNFRLNGCRFRNTRTVVDFQSMSLPGGMTQFSLLHPDWKPEGTALAWEIQPDFGGALPPWVKLDPAVGADNPLAGLPPTVNLRLTMLATQDLAPMIELSEVAVYEAARVRAEFRAVSKRLDFGLSTNTIQTLDVVDDFNPAVHTFEPRIIVNEGAALVAPSVVTQRVDPDKPARREFLATYAVTNATSARLCPGGSTTNVVDVFFGQNTALFAL